MNLVIKGRGDRVSARTRKRLEEKLARLERFEPRVDLVEVEVTREASPRIDGGVRVEASLRAARHTYRAHATGSDVDGALDRMLDRLERQMAQRHDRMRGRRVGAPTVRAAGGREP